MINIGQSFGGIPVYFIRWNPDNYYRKSDTIPHEILKNRYKLCGDLITDIQKGTMVLPQALVSVIYLYYDEWSSLEEEPWRILRPLRSMKHRYFGI